MGHLPYPLKISNKSMVAKGGHINFMFFGPYVLAGSATGLRLRALKKFIDMALPQK